MTARQLLAGLFGGGLVVSLCVLISGLRGGPSTAVALSPTLTRLFGRMDPRRLSGQGRRVVLCAAGAAAVTLWTGWPAMALIGFAAFWHLPRMLGPDRSSQTQADLSDAVATFTEMLRDTLMAAAGIQQTVLAVCPLAPEPIAPACRRLVEAVEAGTPMVAAIAAWANDVADRDADMVAAALITAVKKPSGNTAAVLNVTAEAARDYAAIRRRAMAAQASTRTSARIIIGTVVGLTSLLLLADGDYMQPYDTTLGQMVLLVVACLFAFSIAWIDRIVHPAPEPRLLNVDRMAAQAEEVRTW